MRKMQVTALTHVCGVGGGDQLIANVFQQIRNAELTHWYTEIYDPGMMARAEDMLHGTQIAPLPGGTYKGDEKQETWRAKMVATCNKSDIVLTWGFLQLPDVADQITAPIVQFVQGASAGTQASDTKLSAYADFHIAVSHAARRCLPPHLDVPVIYSGCDPRRVVPAKGGGIQRQEWHVQDHHKMLLFIGRLVPGKNPQALIQALTCLPEEWMGVIIGYGPQLDDLKTEACKYAPGRVHFVPDHQMHIGDALAAADVVLVPSDTEGDPIVIHEAHLSGTPVVASDIPVIQEQSQIFGKLCQTVPVRAAGDVLADAILAAVDGPESRAMITRAQAAAWGSFTTTAAAAKWSEVLETFLAKHRRQALHPMAWRAEGTRPEVELPTPTQIRQPDTKRTQIGHKSDTVKRLHIVYDTSGWAYDARARQLEKHMPEGWVTSSAPLDGGGMPEDFDKLDVIFLMVAGRIQSLHDFYKQQDVPRPNIVVGMNTGPDRNREAYTQAKNAGALVIHNNRASYLHGVNQNAPGEISDRDFCIPNGVDLEFWQENVAEPQLKPASERRPRKVLWCGSQLHAKLKGYDAIEACREPLKEMGWTLETILADSRGDTCTVNFGNGEEQIARYDAKQMRRWYRGGAIFVVTSQSEGTPNPALEAAASGCALTATKVGNIPELIIPGVNGNYIRDTSTSRIMASIRRTTKNRDRLTRGMKKTIAEWDWQPRVARYYEIFRYAVEGGEMPPPADLPGALELCPPAKTGG